MKVVTRYAPSPTGPQHVGGIRTALYAYLFAKKHGGEFILRIEDTDQTRFVAGAEDYILESMAWCGIGFTQGVSMGGPHYPYRQSERKEIYRKYVDELLEKGAAYYAFDTPEELQQKQAELEAAGYQGPTYTYVTRDSMQNSLTLSADEVQAKLAAGEPYVVRMNIPKKVDVRFEDMIRGSVVVNSSHIDDKVLLKSDGMPTYHLANVVDDHLMEVTHVIRGEEWLPSTPLHVLMYKAFGWQPPKFAHLPLILSPGGGKMSKRAAEKYGIPIFPQNWTDPETGNLMPGYRDLGYLPEALLNYLALLGWNPGDEREIFTLDELVEAFSMDRVHKSGAKFDLDKLNFVNESHLRKKPAEALVPMVREALKNAGLEDRDDEFLGKVVTMMVERARMTKDFVGGCLYFYTAPESYDEKIVRKKWKGDAIELLREYLEKFRAVEDWQAAAIKSSFESFVDEKEANFGKVMAPLRLALTGVGGGPDLFEICALIGKEESIRRVETALKKLVPVN